MELSATQSTFPATDHMRKLPTKFELAAMDLHYRQDAQEVLQVSREHAELIAYCNDSEGTLDALEENQVVLALKGANEALDKHNPLEMILWESFKEYLDDEENREWLADEPGFLALMKSYGLVVEDQRDDVVDTKQSFDRKTAVARDTFQFTTPYEELINQYSANRSSASEQTVIYCLTHGTKLISLYNNFEREIPRMSSSEIVECFTEVFSSLKTGFGFQGTFRKAFEDQLFSVFTKLKKIDFRQYQMLLKLSKEGGSSSRILFTQEKPKQVSSRSLIGLATGEALRGKEWLAAAMILGLLVSYPLILKPIHQASRHMFSSKPDLKPGAIK